MEAKEKETMEDAKEIVNLLSQLKEDDMKVAKGYLSALVDTQELKCQKAAG